MYEFQRNQAISFYDKRIQIIQSFLDNADDYISSANSYIITCDTQEEI